MVLELSQFLGGKDTEIEGKKQLVNSYFLSPANLTTSTPQGFQQVLLSHYPEIRPTECEFFTEKEEVRGAQIKVQYGGT